MRTIPLSLLLVLSVGGALAGCSSPGAGRPTASLPAAPSRPAGAVYRLWQDASIFTAVRRMLASAGPGQPVWVEMYEFDRPDLEADLESARDRGADVRLVLDQTVAETARTARRLEAVGVPVRAYPVDQRRHQIDHVKLLLVGGDGLAGGMNWGRTSARNHDYAIETRLPTALDALRAIFLYDWSLAAGRPGGAPSPADGPVFETTPGTSIRTALLKAIRGARHAIVAEVYVLTDREVIAGLEAAAGRGVRVRVVLDRDEESVNAAGFESLTAHGVEARWYPTSGGGKLHAKSALFDGDRLLVGSANWSYDGLSVNHELDLLVDDHEAAAAYADRFRRDWTASDTSL
ncbi:MAG TPA: phosphatidylserine/phosphatidylglycerophosphate/cardiolipin synthase family protein [Candidatus Dormibacteraeota bacterium]|nr:phosphatidylserine/phosphatidylglycerophosphate/cardiolipin synthase family protein [Candidatus Dormibacteraeota bacterium]